MKMAFVSSLPACMRSNQARFLRSGLQEAFPPMCCLFWLGFFHYLLMTCHFVGRKNKIQAFCRTGDQLAHYLRREDLDWVGHLERMFSLCSSWLGYQEQNTFERECTQNRTGISSCPEWLGGCKGIPNCIQHQKIDSRKTKTLSP